MPYKDIKKQKEYCKKYNQEHQEQIKKYKKIYAQVHKEELNEYHRIYRQQHKKQLKKYRQDHKEETNQNMKNYKQINMNYRISSCLRSRLWKALNRNFKSTNTMKLVGCSIEFLREHLQKQFKEGMTWDNYGKWEIDHIRPCSSFDLSKAEEQVRCFNYTNLQPLWEEDNLKKYNIFLMGGDLNEIKV